MCICHDQELAVCKNVCPCVADACDLPPCVNCSRFPCSKEEWENCDALWNWAANEQALGCAALAMECLREPCEGPYDGLMKCVKLLRMKRVSQGGGC